MVSCDESRADKDVLVRLENATKRFPKAGGGVFTAISKVNIDVKDAEFVAVVGPTGCGKSTTLSLISGLYPVSEGTVFVGGKPVKEIPQSLGYMFQTDAALPWKTVLDNVAIGPQYRGCGKAEARVKAHDWIKRVGLAGFEKAYPYQLSGGMKKRMALAQTLVNKPGILLMDEPFSALDVQTRQLMQQELLRLWAEVKAAVIFVTHDLEEAIALADKVVVMTSAPATVKEVFGVSLPRPRNVEEIRMSAEFIDIYRDIWSSLREEVDKARVLHGVGAKGEGEK